MTALAGYFLHDYEKDLFTGRYQDPGNVAGEQTWEDVFSRVSRAIGDTPEQQSRFYRMMQLAIAMPSSPQLWNYGSGRRNPWQGSSCFTGKLGDSIPDFIRCDTDAHDVYMSSGGFGVLANDVRPRGCKISYSKSRSVGSMGIGGPIRKLEKTTGYITNGGRDRGALMAQKGGHHPDFIEFILAKIPLSLGFLDDWTTHARSKLGHADRDEGCSGEDIIIGMYAADYAMEKEWPVLAKVRADIVGRAIDADLQRMMEAGVLKTDHLGRLAPQVWDPSLKNEKDEEVGGWREANRDWDLPLQNCNLSGRIPDALVHAAEQGFEWPFSWHSPDAAKPGEQPWLRTDAYGTLEDIQDGRLVSVHRSNHDVYTSGRQTTEDGFFRARYNMVITTWEGLKENLQPNPNNWKDVEYARFHRKVLVPWLKEYSGKIMAAQVLDLVFKAAHYCADPGVIFCDTYERFCPVDTGVYGPRLSNPCAEFVNPAGGSCDLISPNLRLCSDPVNTNPLGDLFGIDKWAHQGLTTREDWLALRNSAPFQEYLANVREASALAFEYIAMAMDKNVAPVEYLDRMAREDFRTVGVGLMALAEALMHFHVQYGSPCAEFFAAASMAEIYLTCWEGSFDLGKAGAVKPKGWHSGRMESIFNHRLQFTLQYEVPRSQMDRMLGLMDRLRVGEYATHTCVTSVAPTGSISQIVGYQMTRAASNGVVHNKAVSSGVEPPFSWAVSRKDNSGKVKVYHDLWQTAEHGGKPWMQTAAQVSPVGHVRMQAAVQAFCCMGVSKTINLPETATVQDVKDAYLLAWKLGVAGTALYRDNCKPMQVLTALECPSGDCVVDYSKFQATVEAGAEVIPAELPSK